MDTRKLTAFVDLADTKNYSQTAENLFSTQATISKQIIALEKEWHISLFNRAHRKVALTTAGKAVLPYAKKILTEEHQLEAKIAEQHKQSEQNLTIKGIPSISQYQAFKIIAEFTKAHPEINLKFSEAETDQLDNALINNEADIIFTRLFEQADKQLDVLINETDYFVILMPRFNPLASSASLNLEMLKNESFLMLDSATNLFNPVSEILKQADINPKITYQGRRINIILEMLNRGIGVSVMMRKSFNLDNFPNVVAIPLQPKEYSHLAFVKLHDKHSQALDTFWKFATAAI